MKGQRVNVPPTLHAAVACMLLFACVAAALGIGHVARRQRVIRLGYELTDAVAEQRRLQEENRRLRLEKSVLTNPERIERLALAMGLMRPDSGQIRVVNAADAEIAAANRAAHPARVTSERGARSEP